MELVCLGLIALPFLACYLFLNIAIHRMGNTPCKKKIFRVALWTHAIACTLTGLAIILSHYGLLFRWGMSWFLSIAAILSGITIYMIIPKRASHYWWYKLYSAIYYWGIAACIPCWFFVAFIVATLFGSCRVFENRQFSIYNTSTGSSHPKYHQHVVYRHYGPLRKSQAAFTYDGFDWEIQDVKMNDPNAVQVFLKERHADSLELKRDSVLILQTRKNL